ncbi:MAG: hypothetical protein R2825_28890 [Saprospiraceae bacterium]
MAQRNKKKKEEKPKSVVIQDKKAKQPHVQESLSTKWKMIIGALLAVLAMAIYSPSINYDFVYDDDAVIKDNRFVKQGIAGLDEIWTTSYFQGYDETMIARAFRPIPLTTLALEVEMFGLNTKVHHATNLLFYGLTGFFLFLFLAKLMRNYHPFLPIATTLLFLLHPIHLEVVANIKSRDTMLGFLGVCMAGWFLLKHLDNRKLVPLLLSLFFYFIGLFSKEEVITTLASLPLALYFFRKYSIGKIMLTMLPFLGAVVIFLIFRSNVLGGLNEGVKLTYLDNSLLAAKDFAERCSSNVLVLGHYLLKTIFPHPLISDYSYSTIPLVGWNDWRVYPSLIANLGLLGLGIHGLVKRKVYGFGALWYFVSVSIFSSIIVTNVSAYNDRFLYVPVLGICFLVAYLISFLLKPGNKIAIDQSASDFFKHNFVPVAMVILLGALGIMKIESHLPRWKNRYVLFEYDVNLAPKNARMRKNYGGSFARLAIDNQTTDIEAAKRYARIAIEQLDYALVLYPSIPTGHIHKGNMHIILGEYDKAIESLEASLKYAPGNYFATSSLGNVYMRKGDYENAVRVLESIPTRLRNAGDLDVLARSYERLGNTAKAAEIRKGLQ